MNTARRFYKYFGTMLLILGVFGFLLQPVIRVVTAGVDIYVFTPSALLVVAVVGVLIRIECVLRDIRDI